MIINIITMLDNGCGLQREYELLKTLLTEMGHEVRGVHSYQPPRGIKPADLNIFDEILVPRLLPYAPRNWIFPHPEWWHQEWTQWLPMYERVLVKTHNSRDIFNKLMATLWPPLQIFWTGFMSRDFYDPNIERKRAFLHVPGGGRIRNTDAVISAWASRPMPVPLTVVGVESDRYDACDLEACHIKLHLRVSEEELRQLYNSHQFFLMPSAYESWGHAIHEAMGCGALVLTTNAPPMSGFGTPPFLLIPSVGSTPHELAKAHQVKAADVQQAVFTALSLPPELVEAESQKARQQFLNDNGFFRKRLEEVLASV